MVSKFDLLSINTEIQGFFSFLLLWKILVCDVMLLKSLIAVSQILIISFPT